MCEDFFGEAQKLRHQFTCVRAETALIYIMLVNVCVCVCVCVLSAAVCHAAVATSLGPGDAS